MLKNHDHLILHAFDFSVVHAAHIGEMAERLCRDVLQAFSVINSTHSLIATISFLDTTNSALAMNEDDHEELFAYCINVKEAFNLMHVTLLHNGNQPEPPRQRALLFPDFCSSNFPGRDLLTEFDSRPWLLYVTGETVESFMTIVRTKQQ